MRKDIKLKWFYAYPVETIWKCLTNPEILKEWWVNTGEFKAEVGFKWMEVSKPRKQFDWDGKMYFEILEVVPLKKLSYSFKGGPRPGEYNLDTVVTWTLIQREEGTELHLEQTGFSGFKNYMSAFIMEIGWKKQVSKRFKISLGKHFSK